MNSKTPHLFCFGLGYCARAIGHELLQQGWSVSGCVRSDEKKQNLEQEGFKVFNFDPQNKIDLPPESLSGVTHILISAPPGGEGDLVVEHASSLLKNVKDGMQWIGYFSTTGVYGDHDGGWVDEETPVSPSSDRGARRVLAEKDWQQLSRDIDTPLNIFRLPGIYGPGRNAFVSLKNGKARRIIKKGQVFGRIHLDDIVQTVLASIEKGGEGSIYNIVDDDTAPPQDVISYAASLLGVDPPPEIEFEKAELSPMARSFYGENKRVRNDRIKEKLGIKLKYPDYRVGLNALFDTLP